MNIRELHNKAMELADLADWQNRRGNKNDAISLYEESFSLEYEAAMNAYNSNVGEPSVSVLLRSAASLAMNCKKLRESEKLIALALSGEPPFEIAEELRNLLENVNFYRHLEVKGTELSDDEVQLVIAGHGVGFGYVKTDEILNRINWFKILTARTVERRLGKSFKTGSMTSEHKKILNNAYMSTPQAASMAFRIKFGNLNNFPVIPGFGSYEDIVEDITENITLINENKIDILKEKITDTAYFNNFLSLTKELAPDGKIVNLFGITCIKQGQERKTFLTERKEKISEVIKFHQSKDESGTSINSVKKGTNQTVTGILRVADATKNIVEIIVDSNHIKLLVPDGLSDIVRKYWDEKVVVEYHKKSQKDNLLMTIEEANE